MTAEQKQKLRKIGVTIWKGIEMKAKKKAAKKATKKAVKKKTAKKKAVKKAVRKSTKYDLRNLVKGDSVIYKNVGYGLITYEHGKNHVLGIKDGILTTKTFDSSGMEWDEFRSCWAAPDSGLGLRCYAISKNDPDALKWIKDYNG